MTVQIENCEVVGFVLGLALAEVRARQCILKKWPRAGCHFHTQRSLNKLRLFLLCSRS